MNKSYEKYGFLLEKWLPDVPPDVIHTVCLLVGSLVIAQIMARLPKDLSSQLVGGGTVQSLVAVATGNTIPLKAALLRFLVSTLFLASGGSLGGEGPAIQICTSFAMLIGWYFGIRSMVTQSLLASLGFSCGFAASFNAPVAGILFAMEELQHVSTNLSQSTIYMILVAAVVSTSVARATAGNSILFRTTWTQDMFDAVEGGSIHHVYGYNMWMLIAIPVGILCSVCGLCISRVQKLMHGWLKQHDGLSLTSRFVMQACAAAAAGSFVFRTTGLRGVWGIGAESLQKLFDQDLPDNFDTLNYLAFALGKAVALVSGISVRVPADILEPLLMTGGFIGGAVGNVLRDPQAAGNDAETPCIILGMVGLFASCFRFPLTPIVLVVEITGIQTYTVILPAALCSFTAVTCSNYLFPALMDDILDEEGIDLHLLAQEAEEGYQEEERQREMAEVGDDDPGSAADSDEDDDDRGNRQGSKDRDGGPPLSSINLMLRGLEQSMLQQARGSAASSQGDSTPRSSPASSRRPSVNGKVRRPSNASAVSSLSNCSGGPIRRRPSDVSIGGDIFPSSRKVGGHASNLHGSGPVLRVPLQPVLCGSQSSTANLSFSVQQVRDAHGSESFVLQIRPLQDAACMPVLLGSSSARTPSSSFGLPTTTKAASRDASKDSCEAPMRSLPEPGIAEVEEAENSNCEATWKGDMADAPALVDSAETPLALPNVSDGARRLSLDPRVLAIDALRVAEDLAGAASQHAETRLSEIQQAWPPTVSSSRPLQRVFECLE
eukprot:TRINITY_DN106141_c0_g1_i1.p1 TRINITY_DN106141_c0_g1~~TRINITY_DN106141_c0_g1_i1.p1  ORF type:complete len:888 (+),score=166.45 TRINITY_DN106141_c0_g1_i1:337-2664(+)